MQCCQAGPEQSESRDNKRRLYDEKEALKDKRVFVCFYHLVRRSSPCITRCRELYGGSYKASALWMMQSVNLNQSVRRVVLLSVAIVSYLFLSVFCVAAQPEDNDADSLRSSNAAQTASDIFHIQPE